MNEKEKVDLFSNVDFGDIDANADPNLDKYFIDNGYWNNIVDSPIYYVIGKKGTGKSALYKMLEKNAITNGIPISNCDFGDFPFNKLMQLSDDDFSKPNQYQSIWQLVILNQFVSLIMSNDNTDHSNIYYKKLAKYFKMCIGDTVDLHRISVTNVKKKEHSLQVANIGINPGIVESKESALTYSDSYSNISIINRSLLSDLTEYFKTADYSPYLIQFDRLDDTYNQYTEKESYFHLIISLMKTVYSINNHFRSLGISQVKTIVYLRTDIIDELGKRDAESARWDDFTYRLNWAIVNKSDWYNPPLKQMLDKRIVNSLQQELSFDDLFNSNIIRINRSESMIESHENRYMDVFQYMTELTLHRPRDLIKFCKCIQHELSESHPTKISFRTIKNAEKEYCFWLVNAELSNEINPIISDTEKLYSLLRSLGSKPFSFNDFYLRYSSTENYGLTMSKDKLISYLYDVGILMNVNTVHGQQRYRSKVRNHGTVDRSMKLMIHPGVWKGINA